MIAGQIVNGLMVEGLYALVAVGFPLIMGVLRRMNFAHTEMFTVAGFVGLVVAQAVRAAGIDGGTPIAAARDKQRDGLVATKTLRGVNELRFDVQGSGIARTSVRRVAPVSAAWKCVPTAT